MAAEARHKLRRLLALFILCVSHMWGSPTFAQSTLPVPALSARVIDQTGILTTGEQQQLEGQLANTERQLGAQIVVLLVPTTAPEDIAAYAWRVADQWKIGRRDVGDGVLLVVALQDRRIRIEVARALEGAIPDLLAKRIIDEQLMPAFRQGQFAHGLSSATQALTALIQGEHLPPPEAMQSSAKASAAEPEAWLGALFFVFVAARVLTATLGQTTGGFAAPIAGALLAWWMTGAWFMLVAGALVGLVSAVVQAMQPELLHTRAASRQSRHMGSGSWGGGRSSGGGFSSGGGGGFGGGGASGGW